MYSFLFITLPPPPPFPVRLTYSSHALKPCSRRINPSISYNCSEKHDFGVG